MSGDKMILALINFGLGSQPKLDPHKHLATNPDGIGHVLDHALAPQTTDMSAPYPLTQLEDEGAIEVEGLPTEDGLLEA